MNEASDIIRMVFRGSLVRLYPVANNPMAAIPVMPNISIVILSGIM